MSAVMEIHPSDDQLRGAAFAMYARWGFSLCEIASGSKGPRSKGWNKSVNAINDPARAAKLKGAGLLHVSSGTCAVDIDDLEGTRAGLAKLGIDIDALLNAPDAVKISSGRENRGKLLYYVPQGVDPATLQSLEIESDDRKRLFFELRCADKSGNSKQDVLPGTIHPQTGKPYVWEFNTQPQSFAEFIEKLDNMPELPEVLLRLWQQLLRSDMDRTGELREIPARDVVFAPTAAPRTDTTLAERILATVDPDCGYDDWWRLGAALHHDLGEAGFELWNSWSAKSIAKYPGEAELAQKWQSFGRSAKPLTLHGYAREFGIAQVASKDDFDDLTTEQKHGLLKLLTIGDALEAPWPEWIIRGVLPRAEIIMVYGPSGAGKSALVQNMALAVARGVDWWTHDVRQGGVLWLAAEAAGSMRARLTAYAQAHDLTLEQLKALPFYWYASCDLSDEKFIDSLIESIRGKGLQVVVVDTLAAASGKLDENSGEMNVALAACRRIFNETGTSVVLVHHSGKDDAKGARGWSGIRAAVQAELRVEMDGDRRRVTITKQRDGSSGTSYWFGLRTHVVGMDERNQPITSVSVVSEGKVEKGETPAQDARAPAGRNALVCRVLEEAGGELPFNELRTRVRDALKPPKNPDSRDGRWNNAKAAIGDCHDGGFVTIDGDRVRLVGGDDLKVRS